MGQGSRLFTILLWVALLAAVTIEISGFRTSRILRQTIWSPEGLKRFLWYGLVFAGLGAVLLFQKRYFVPLVLGTVVLGTLVAVGPAAVKTGLNYALAEVPGLLGVVTADADGQHDSEDIIRIASRLRKHPEALILGVRQWEERVPWKNRMGNLVLIERQSAALLDNFHARVEIAGRGRDRLTRQHGKQLLRFVLQFSPASPLSQPLQAEQDFATGDGANHHAIVCLNGRKP